MPVRCELPILAAAVPAGVRVVAAPGGILLCTVPLAGRAPHGVMVGDHTTQGEEVHHGLEAAVGVLDAVCGVRWQLGPLTPVYSTMKVQRDQDDGEDGMQLLAVIATACSTGEGASRG